MLGLNESGNGVSKVYIRSSESGTATESGITSAYDIADGKSLGTIDYGQWNHFAITKKVLHLEHLKMVFSKIHGNLTNK